jgi:hypothetical protein
MPHMLLRSGCETTSQLGRTVVSVKRGSGFSITNTIAKSAFFGLNGRIRVDTVTGAGYHAYR